MTTIRYTFRPSLFHQTHTLVVDDSGLMLREGDKDERRVAFDEIEEVHIEPATAGDDDQTRWLMKLSVRHGKPIQIDSVNVRGAADFEHKTDEFLKVVSTIHTVLAPRGDAVRYRFGTRRIVIVAWRIALFLCLVAGIFGSVAAIATGEFEALFGAGSFVMLGLLGLAMLRGKGGPKSYRPDAVPKGDADASTGT